MGCLVYHQPALCYSNQLYSQQFCPYLSMFVSPQDLLVRLNCRPQQTKNNIHYRLQVIPRLAG